MGAQAQLTSKRPKGTEEARVRPLVLIVDPNETTRSVLEVALARDGFDVWSASAGAKAIELVHQGPAPDVVVVEADLGKVDGVSFVAQLRAESSMGKTPVLLLSRSRRSLDALADVVGIDVFIQKPAYARDVVALVRLEHLRRQGGGQEVELDASQISAALLLRALLSCPRSGRLELLGGRGELWFRGGRIVRARLDRGNDLEALVRSLALAREGYTLSLEPVDVVAELECGLRELVSVVMPRLARWERVQERSLPLGSRLVVDFGRLGLALKTLPDGVNRVVQLFDGFRSLEDVVIDSPHNETLTLEVATRLYTMGVLVPEATRSSQAKEGRSPPATDELMRELFDGEPGSRPVDQPSLPPAEDWFEEPSGAGLDLADPAGGWTAASASEVTSGLPEDLGRQLEAFQIQPEVEWVEATAEDERLRSFLRGDDDVFTALDHAARAAVAEPPSLTRSSQAAAPSTTKGEVTAADLLAEALMSRAWPSVMPAANEGQPAAPVAEATKPALSKAPSLSQLPLVPDALGSTAQPPAPASTGLRGMFPESSPSPVPRAVIGAADGRPVRSVPRPTPAAEALEKDFFDAPDSGSEPEETPAPRRPSQRKWPWLVAGLAVLLVGVGIEWLVGGQQKERAPSPPIVASAPAPSPAPAQVIVAAEAPPKEKEVEPEPAAKAEETTPPARAPADPPALQLARRAYEYGQYQKAAQALELLVRDTPSAAAWLLLGQVRYDAMDLTGARKAAEQVLVVDPHNAPVQMLLASMYFDAHDQEAARASLSRYLELDPNGPFAAEARSLLKR